MKLDRRKFIKLGAVGSGALALPNPLKLAEQKRKPWNRQQARTLRKYRNPRPTTCSLCANRCGLISYREGDRVVMLHGNPEHPLNHGKLCAKAYGQLDRLYDPDRLLKPRVRVGKRGAGEWREISWSEAYKIVAEKLAPYVENGGSGLALMFGRREMLAGELQKIFPKALVVEDDPARPLKSLRRYLYGVTGCRYDFANARFILNFAADPYIRSAEMVSETQQLIKGRVDNGAKLVTVAGRLSNTGGRSDHWIPVNPADYGDLARALSIYLVKKGLFDRKALAAQTFNADDLKRVLQDYTPEKVGPAIGVKVADIKQLARELVRRKPAMVIYDDELLNAPDGRRSAVAIELLNLLIGALGRPGGISYFSEEEGQAAPVSGPAAGDQDRQVVTLEWFAVSGEKPAVINYGCNPVYTTCNAGEQQFFWRNPNRIPFHLAIDTHLSETTQYADLVLPVATELESWGLFDQPLADGQRVLSLRQPVSRYQDEILLLRQAKIKNLDILFSESPRKPVAEAREFNQIVLELKEILGGGKAEAAPRVEERIQEFLKQPAFVRAGISFAKLREKGFQVYSSRPAVPQTKISATFADLVPLGEREEWKGNSTFCLIPYSWHVLDNQTANCKYLAELRHDNPLWIHPSRAARLGIAEGDEVRLETDSGSVVTKAWLTQAIHPQCVAIAFGLGHTALGRVAQGKTIAKSDPMTRALLIHKPIHFTPFSFRLDSWDKKEPIWWHDQGNGVNVRSILKNRLDERLAGTTVFDTRVQVRKE
ncbi:MAG: molybdopterin-dependent oxidoreductase [Deltaproteobacteria bacterium]|nr:molybdopterin-dependent oxidoreductase [Deltaproteobacteria bacterium]